MRRAAPPQVQFQPNALFWMLAIVAGVYIAGRITGRSRGKAIGHVKAQVNTDFVDPNFSAEVFAMRVHQGLSGWNFWTKPRAELLTEIYYLNDEELKALYNAYNRQFAKPPATLVTLIRGEWIWGEGVNRVLRRFEQLGLP
jgi:hypothetical protein